MESFDLFDVIEAAKNRLIILGVVNSPIEWSQVCNVFIRRMKEDIDYSALILCESDNALFFRSLILDNSSSTKRTTFSELIFLRDQCLQLKELLVAAGGDFEYLGRIQVKIIHIPIPLQIVLADTSLFVNPNVSDYSTKYYNIPSNHPWRKYYLSYLQSFTGQSGGLKFSSYPEDELLELFDHNRIPRGIFPRNSFYDTDYSQLVVWGFVFDRSGRLLIHRRSSNAKDNRGMWDKSIGGHVDFSIDVDSSRAVARELIEELFVDEIRETKFSIFQVSDENMIYLGEWNPKKRKEKPFNEINTFSKEWAFFRLSKSQQIYSPRMLSDERVRALRIIADVYFFVATPKLSEKLGELRNSEYKLVELSELKNVMERSLKKEKSAGFDHLQEVPLFTPDLTNTMTGYLRDMLSEFSAYRAYAYSHFMT